MGEADRDDPIEELLARQGVVVLDGGLATELEAHGHDLGDELWSARLLADAPDAILRVHREALEAGADCVTAASYQATIAGFVRRGRSEAAATELLLDSVRIAMRARDEFWSVPERRAGRLRPLVAASVGPYGAALADGSEYRGDYDLDEDELVEFHRRRFELLAGSGADLLACETVPSAPEARALARLLAERPGIPAWLSFTCRDGERISDGTPLEAIVAELEAVPRILALGVNCTAPRFVPSLLARARHATAKPLVAYPNSGERYDAERRRWTAREAATEFGGASRQWRARGAVFIGGCCRTGPREIAAVRRALLGGGERGDSVRSDGRDERIS